MRFLARFVVIQNAVFFNHFILAWYSSDPFQAIAFSGFLNA